MGTDTITPTAIDAFVRLEYVKVVGRHRRDLGDVDKLAQSIEEVGLLHPLTLTRDGRLIAGQRRLEACRQLGWREVPVRFADNLTDATKLLHAERDENTCRKDMLPSEMASLGSALHELESDAAKTRQREHAGTAPGRNGNTSGDISGSVLGSRVETRDAVGNALGMSGRTYDFLRKAHAVANDPTLPQEERDLGREALAEMDLTGRIWRPGQKLTRRLSAKREADEVKTASAEPSAEPSVVEPVDGWVPFSNDSSASATARRRAVLRELAPKGYTSEQIGARINLKPERVRIIAREIGVVITADAAMFRTHRRIDSNRIIRETVRELADAEMALDLVSFDELDVTEVEAWTTSLSKSIRRLSQLNKRLKEMIQ